MLCDSQRQAQKHEMIIIIKEGCGLTHVPVSVCVKQESFIDVRKCSAVESFYWNMLDGMVWYFHMLLCQSACSFNEES